MPKRRLLLKALEGGPQSVPELTSKLKRTTLTPKSLAHLLKILQRQNSKVICGSVGCDDDGRYHLTETGRQALTQRRKLLGSGRPRHRVRHEEVSQRDVSNNVAAEKPVGCGERLNDLQMLGGVFEMIWKDLGESMYCKGFEMIWGMRDGMISRSIDSNHGFADVLSRILEDVSHRWISPGQLTSGRWFMIHDSE